MNVKILKVETGEFENAIIRLAKTGELPSINDGWKFNFGKQSRKIKHSQSWVLVAGESPAVVEGCLIFEMKNEEIPFMAFVEVAPHNRTSPKRFENVAGCLIAFACKQSLLKGEGQYKGWLTFEVGEEYPADQIKVMAVYSKKYGAYKMPDSNIMFIDPEQGAKLVNTYLTN